MAAKRTDLEIAVLVDEDVAGFLRAEDEGEDRYARGKGLTRSLWTTPAE